LCPHLERRLERARYEADHLCADATTSQRVARCDEAARALLAFEYCW